MTPEEGDSTEGLGGEGSTRPAFYALSPGGWRDYWTLLHPPYTLWHLSYVVLGASLASDLNLRWLGETLLAFFLAMGVGAHALDELNGRPLRTRIGDRILVVLAIVGVAGAVALGVHGTIVLSAWIWVFIVIGVFLVPAYNLELFGGAFHSDLWFALAWGGFPALTAFFAQTGRVSVASFLLAGGCVGVSWAQRILSTPVRMLRRHVEGVSGTLTMFDGTTRAIDSSALRVAPEGALRLLSLAMPLLAAATLVAAVSRT
jgi:hypothetical protein